MLWALTHVQLCDKHRLFIFFSDKNTCIYYVYILYEYINM